MNSIGELTSDTESGGAERQRTLRGALLAAALTTSALGLAMEEVPPNSYPIPPEGSGLRQKVIEKDCVDAIAPIQEYRDLLESYQSNPLSRFHGRTYFQENVNMHLHLMLIAQHTGTLGDVRGHLLSAQRLCIQTGSPSCDEGSLLERAATVNRRLAWVCRRPEWE